MYSPQLEYAKEKVLGKDRERKKIGTLSEKSLHAILKYYFEPNSENHEIKLGTFYADALGEEGIFEIQTRAAYRLKPKLIYLLAVSRVTLVIPVIASRELIWIDPDTGEMSTKRRVPRKGKLSDAFTELFGIKELLSHPNLRVCIMYLNVLDYKLLNSKDKTRKKKADRYDRIPEEIIEEIYLNVPEDYLELIENIPEGEFTVPELIKLNKMKSTAAYSFVHVMEEVGLIKQTEKIGRAQGYVLVRS